MKKLYIIISSWGEHSDHHTKNECVCSSLFFAENKKTEIENKYREKILFPFKWCTEEDFRTLLQKDETTMEDEEVFYKWEDDKRLTEDFNECYIQEIDYYE